MMTANPPIGRDRAACETCSVHRAARLKTLGVSMEKWDFIVALPGNPNTGKSTVFNALTGLHQHTGNWPGKTVSRAEGGFEFDGRRYKLIDLPGTYSLLATSTDEQIARDFILFGQPDVTVIVVDATRLERNLNLVLQVLAITDRAVVCLNLIDEARRLGVQVDDRQLARELGVPVVPTSARYGVGLRELLEVIRDVATGRIVCRPRRLRNESPELLQALARVSAGIEAAFPGLPNARWIALRLLSGDERVMEAVRTNELAALARGLQANATGVGGMADAAPLARPAEALNPPPGASDVLDLASSLRREFSGDFHERVVQAVYAEAAGIAGRALTPAGQRPAFDIDRAIDRVVTSRVWGFPVMLLLFALVFWITISGANIPSRWISAVLIDTVYPWLREGATSLGWPWWLRGVAIDGMYLATAWVVSVMLPPMAIFFPLFTLLEDFGYLPRVAFNLDNLFKKAGAHGKQALSMMMGYGCNAAGVISTRIIDSPRERLIAILTNNFALCNGRWPTQILIASLFIGSLVPAPWAGLISAGAVLAVTLLGVALTLVVSWGLSRTILKGHLSSFSLELPPYRPPRVWQALYTSLIDRTMFVLWRAVVFALPAGAVIWLIANLRIGGTSAAEHVVGWLNPAGLLIGLNGVILLSYVLAIPANEIVVPTILMLTALTTGLSDVGHGAGVLFEIKARSTLLSLLQAGGWTLLTAVNLMLFSLVHNPCSTTLYTIYKETGSVKWTAVAAMLPLTLGAVLTFCATQVWRLLHGV